MSSAISSASASASSSHAAGLVDSAANPNFKIVGICLAVGSGFLIGASFVIKKKGLLSSTQKYGTVAGEGHAYLKSWMWWAGMITMILGEVCNFVAYAFTEAILVTPMGALSVVVAAILSHFILKEKLTFFGWIGCTLCIIGAVILALNAPEQQSVTTINEFKKYFLSVGFLVWASILIATSLVLVFFVAPKWGKKSMMPYIAICSLIGGISVSCTQGLGASIVTSIQGNNQVKNWFFWFLFVFVVVTLLTEINYLNKALELFNTSMVVPVYFCFFSSATLITSFILYQGLKASAVTLITMVLGFLVTCLGITLLQLSKVDPEALDHKLDRKSTMLMAAAKHQTEDAEKGQMTSAEDPGMDALRGGFGAVGSIIRARSISRRLSNASSLTGGKMYGYSSGNLSTQGMGNLQRFQLSDSPMPIDAMDQISLHSAKSPSAISAHGFQPGHSYFPSPTPTPQRSKSQLKFEEADVVHQYHYGSGSDPDATHTFRPHPQNSGGPSARSRQNSLAHAYPPVMEEPEELDDRYITNGRPGNSDIHPRDYGRPQAQRGHDGSSTGYSDPYADPQPLRLNAPSFGHPLSPGVGGGGSSSSPRSPSAHKGLGGLFHFPSGPDLSFHLGGGRSKSKDRSGESPREEKHDYPQLTRRDRHDDVEREERTALVFDRDQDEGDGDGDGDEGRGGISPVGSDDSQDGRTLESAEVRSGGPAAATIGVGHRVNLSMSQPSVSDPGPAAPAASGETTSTAYAPPSARGSNVSIPGIRVDSPLGVGAGSGSPKGPRGPKAASGVGAGSATATASASSSLASTPANGDLSGFAGPRYR
ncbi:hypothetical protein IAU60_006707 [Kwoniella sp. DSM 27419]